MFILVILYCIIPISLSKFSYPIIRKSDLNAYYFIVFIK